MKKRHRKSIAPREREYDSDDSLEHLTPKKIINISSTSHKKSLHTPTNQYKQNGNGIHSINKRKSGYNAKSTPMRRTSNISTASDMSGFSRTLKARLSSGKKSLDPRNEPIRHRKPKLNRQMSTKSIHEPTIDYFDEIYSNLQKTIKLSEKKLTDYDNHKKTPIKKSKRRKSIPKRKASLLTLPSSLKSFKPKPHLKEKLKPTPTLKNNEDPTKSSPPEQRDVQYSLNLPIALSPDIRSKIFKLRSDPSELDSFHKVVEKIQNERGINTSAKKLQPIDRSPNHRVKAIGKNDILLYNPNIGNMQNKKNKSVRSKKQQLETRWTITERHANRLREKMDAAIKKHDSLQHEKLMKHMSVAFAPPTNYEELDNRLERLKEYDFRIKASQWATIAVLFRFVRVLNHNLVHKRMDRLHTVVINEDADDIAHSLFHIHHEECSRTMRKERVHPIATNAYIARFRYLVSRKQLAAKMIREFFRWQNDIAHSRVLLASYVEKVKRSQRMIRSFINIRLARIELLKRQFDKYELERIAKRREPLELQRKSLKARVQHLERKIAHKKDMIGSSSNHWAANVEFAAMNAKMMNHYDQLNRKFCEIDEKLNDKSLWSPFPDSLKYAYIKSYLQKRNMAHIRLQVKLKRHYRLFARFKKMQIEETSPIASPIFNIHSDNSVFTKPLISNDEFRVGRQPILMEKSALPEVYRDIQILYETEMQKQRDAKKRRRSKYARRESLHSLSTNSMDESRLKKSNSHIHNQSILFTQTSHDLTKL